MNNPYSVSALALTEISLFLFFSFSFFSFLSLPWQAKKRIFSMHYDLIVYKNSYDLLLLLYNLSSNFSKEYKYSLGEKIKDEILELLVDIYRANNCFENRLANIKIALNRIERITIYTRILKDLKQINLKKFVLLNEKIEIINRQLISWKNKS